MAWIKIDDQAPHHPKLLKVGAAAAWAWLCAIAYCQRHLTDGFVPFEAVCLLGVTKPNPLIATLVHVGLFERAEGGYHIHDYLDFQQSADEVKVKLEWDRRRKGLYADQALVEFIKTRDGGCCRYCGVRVNWQDRRGPTGGQFDHVVPRGPNTADNLVVSCRACNQTKGDRTPEQVGFRLRPISGPSSDLVLGTSSEPVPNQFRTSSPRARVADANAVSGSSSGFGGGPGEPGHDGREGRFWERFTAVAARHGYDHRLPPKHNEFRHLQALCQHYTDAELEACAELFWVSPVSPSLPADRNLGWFAEKIGALMRHLRDGASDPFGAPAPTPARVALAGMDLPPELRKGRVS